MPVAERPLDIRHYEKRDADPVGRLPCGELRAVGSYSRGERILRRRDTASALTGSGSWRDNTLLTQDAVIDDLVHSRPPGDVPFATVTLGVVKRHDVTGPNESSI
jgi:hypothetical protein